MAAPIIVPSATISGSGPTLLRLWQRLADELGFWLPTTVSEEATSGEATRVVLADETRDDEAGYDIGGQWLYVRTGAQATTQRRMLRQDGVGYQGSQGAVILSRPLDEPLAPATVIDVTNPLPVRRHLGTKGLVDLVNEGLGLIWTKARLTFTGNGTDSYDLAAYPWLENANQILGVYDTSWNPPTRSPVLSPYSYRVVSNGVTRSFVSDRPQVYSAAETFYLDVAVRADRLVYDGSSWAYATTPGLQADNWQAACPEAWAVAFAKVKAFEYLSRYINMSQQLPDQQRQAYLADIQRRRNTASITALRIKQNLFPKTAPERRASLVQAPSVGAWI